MDSKNLGQLDNISRYRRVEIAVSLREHDRVTIHTQLAQ